MDENGLRTALQTLLIDLEGPELDYVLARSRNTTNKAGYGAAGICKSAYYTWPEERRQHLNTVADALRRDRVQHAHILMREAVVDLTQELIELAKQRDKNIKLRAIDSLLDRVLGKPTQRRELSGVGGGPIEHKDVTNLSDTEAGRRLMALLERGAAEALVASTSKEQRLSEDVSE